MLYLPSTTPPGKRSKTGIVGTYNPAGWTLRRRGAQIQRRSPSQLLWRGIFRAAKQNWLGIGPGGANNAPTDGLDPQSAWAIQSGSYLGILTAGPITGNVQGQGGVTGCASVEAFQVMVQTTLATLGLATAAAPACTQRQAAQSPGPWSATTSPVSLSVAGQVNSGQQPILALFGLGLTVAVSAYPTPSAYTQNGAFWWPLVLNQLALTQGGTATARGQANYPPLTFPTITDQAWSVSGLPSGVTAQFNGNPAPATLAAADETIVALTLTADATATPGTYTVTVTNTDGTTTNQNFITLVVYSTAQNTYTFSASGLPADVTAAMDPPALVPVYDPTTNTLTASGTVTVTITTADAAGTVTFSAALSTPAGSISVSPEYVVTATGYQSNLPCPDFDLPSGLSGSTIYALDFTVAGFQLEFGNYNDDLYPMRRYGVPIPGAFIITASPAYTSSYSTPSISTWSPILVAGPFMPNPAEILAAWVGFYGDLPTSGNIGFLAQYCDPDTGTPGPPAQCTVTWQVGTLKGYDQASWAGPDFGIAPLTLPSPIATPGSSTATFEVGGVNGYGGTITFSVKSRTIISNGANTTTKTLPPGVTFTFSPPTATVPPGSTTPITTTLTITAASGATNFNGNISVEATDGISTHTSTFNLTTTGGTAPPLQPNYLSMAASPTTEPTSVASPFTIALTVENTGPDTQYVVLLASSTNPALGFAFDTVALTVPGGTLLAPGTATANCTVTIASSISAPLTFIQFTCEAGAFTNYAYVGFVI